MLKTIDSGATWTPQTSEQSALRGVHFADANAGVIVGNGEQR